MFRLLMVDDEKNERDCLLYLIQNARLPFEVREAEKRRGRPADFGGMDGRCDPLRRPDARHGRSGISS